MHMPRRIFFIFSVVGLPILCFFIAVFIAHMLGQYPIATHRSTEQSPSDSQKAFATFKPRPNLFSIQSIDTMKDSRDRARSGASDASYATLIYEDVAAIASAGATHIAIDTPYDAEFLPVLREWVKAARAKGLSVWFRGNFSGWEGWFGYPKIGRSDHIAMTKQFILNNPSMFADGDIFSACPECENGGPGDPRKTGDLDGYRQFLISEYSATRDAFSAISKKVDSAPTSMNLDVAKLVMDPPTAKALGNVVSIDNYTKTPEQFASDIDYIHDATGGARVIIGEFGAPIPDINGGMSDDEQARHIDKLMASMHDRIDVIDGVNYWVIRNGSTGLLSDSGSAKPAMASITKYFKAPYALGSIHDDFGKPVRNYSLLADSKPLHTDSEGRYQLFLPSPGANVTISDPADLYPDLSYTPKAGTSPASDNDLILVPKHVSLWRAFLRYFSLPR